MFDWEGILFIFSFIVVCGVIISVVIITFRKGRSAKDKFLRIVSLIVFFILCCAYFYLAFYLAGAIGQWIDTIWEPKIAGPILYILAALFFVEVILKYLERLKWYQEYIK